MWESRAVVKRDLSKVEEGDWHSGSTAIRI